jgi:hypothetical protein
MNASQLRTTARPLALAVLALLVVAGPAPGAVRTGTAGNDTLVGTNRNDQITGDAGDDTLKGLAGDDVYHFADGWGADTLEEKRAYRVGGEKQPGGVDTLSFRGVTAGVAAHLVPEWRGVNPAFSAALGLGGGRVDLGGSRLENVVGSPGGDEIFGGVGPNRLATGGGRGDGIGDLGGWDDGAGDLPELPPSDDAFVGVAANTGTVHVLDWGGAADVLDLRPLRRTEVFLNRVDCGDGDAAKECLQVVTGAGGTGQVLVYGHFGAYNDYPTAFGQEGRVEELRFVDGTVSFAATARAAGAIDGEALIGQATTERQKQLAERASDLAEEARTGSGALLAPGALPHDRGA